MLVAKAMTVMAEGHPREVEIRQFGRKGDHKEGGECLEKGLGDTAVHGIKNMATNEPLMDKVREPEMCQGVLTERDHNREVPWRCAWKKEKVDLGSVEQVSII